MNFKTQSTTYLQKLYSDIRKELTYRKGQAARDDFWTKYPRLRRYINQYIKLDQPTTIITGNEIFELIWLSDVSIDVFQVLPSGKRQAILDCIFPPCLTKKVNQLETQIKNLCANIDKEEKKDKVVPGTYFDLIEYHYGRKDR